MLVGNISLDQLILGLTGGSETSGVASTGEAQEGVFSSLLAGPLKATSEEGLDNPIFKSLILKSLQNPEMSEQIKNALTNGGKISLEINNPKDTLAGLLALSQDVDTNIIGVALDDDGASINIEDLLKSIDVKEVVVDSQQVQNLLNEFSEKLTSMLNDHLAKIENADIENKEELIQFINTLEESLGIIEQVLPQEVQVDVSNINIENSEAGEIELVADSEIPEMIIEPDAQVENEVVPVEDEAIPIETVPSEQVQEEQAAGALEVIKNALTQILEKVIDKVNSRQDTKVIINTDKTSAKIDEQLLEKFALLTNVDPENLKDIDVKIAPNPSAVNKLEAQLNKILGDVKQVLNQELNGKDLNLDKIAESLKTNLESIVNSTQQLSESNDIKVVIPKNTLKSELTPAMNKDMMKLQAVEQEAVKLEKLETINVQNETSKASQMDKSTEVSKIASFKPTEALGINNKGKDDLLDALIDKKVSKLEIDKSQSSSDSSTNSNLFQNGSTSSDKGLFNMLLDNQSDPAISGLKSASSLFTSKMNALSGAGTPTNIETPAQQLTNKIRESYGKNEIELSLNPNRLGNVKVNVAMQRGALVASIVAETSKALESLKSGADSLRNALAESGLNVDRVVITQADQSSQTSNNNDSNGSTKEQASNSQNQQNGSEANKEKAQEFKDTMEFIQTKQAEKPARMDRTLTGNNIDQNTSDIQTNQTATKEDNYINTEKGFVNYRV